VIRRDGVVPDGMTDGLAEEIAQRQADCARIER
jgi:hypothetical protein